MNKKHHLESFIATFDRFTLVIVAESSKIPISGSMEPSEKFFVGCNIGQFVLSAMSTLESGCKSNCLQFCKYA